ncbi:MAG TPA: pirin family protein [Candidatus Paceibacterota bacterium]|nr:pirin family protein [Candidatus Paceibacterota bacterium]
MRTILRTYPLQETMEGAGVRLGRGIHAANAPAFDPFLMFDDFTNAEEADYVPGFPMHPHRGMETVTYILGGRVRHRDSLGNEGVIEPGGVQWMTAGSGIIHEEMPEVSEGGVSGFQLWVNLPRERKMTEPRYRNIVAGDIPVAKGKGHEVRVIAGTYEGVAGPVSDLAVPVTYLDVSLAPDASVSLPARAGDTSFLYVVSGSVVLRDERGESWANAREVALLSDGDGVELSTGATGARFLFISGLPIKEPIAWYGPIVMNTKEEIDEALWELRDGTFVKTAGH